jgi:hypothetical protein
MADTTSEFERSLLRDADIAFGAKHYELLRTIGAFVQQLKDGSAQVRAGGSMKGIAIEDERLEEGPSLLTLVRLAHSTASRLVLSLEDADGSGECVEVLRI